MVRIIFLVAGVSCLGACTGWPANDGAGVGWQAAGSAAHAFRFDWRLSGDPAVAPMQVFDDGKDVWLQFAPGQPLPAIFGVRANVEHALPYTRRDPYAVVAGAWDALRFRGGRLTARAEREARRDTQRDTERAADVAAAPGAPVSMSAEAAVAVPLAGVGQLAGKGPLGTRDAPVLAASLPGDSKADISTAGALTAAVSSGAASTSDTSISGVSLSAIPSPNAAAAVSRYRAAPPDTTLRAVLARWAGDSGWTFRPQHWAVDVDIPLSASADFSGDFKSAVRELLSATELADKPLQPCFYGNQVLRVVPLAQPCSRAAPAQGGGA